MAETPNNLKEVTDSNNPFFKDGDYTPIPDPRMCKPRVFGRIPLHSSDSDDESGFSGYGPMGSHQHRDICKDGGLLKYIRERGNTNQNIKDLCKHIDHNDVLVGVKYKVWLDDEKNTFIKQSDGVEEYPFKFGFFCPALQIAIKTMKIGEKSTFFVKPQYGFGDEGKPAYGDEVKLIGKLQDGTVFLNKGHSDDETELFEFKTGEEQVVEGLEEAVMAMKKGEVALLTIPPQYAFGSSESQQELAVVPPNSTLCYEVELVSFVKEKGFQDMNNEEKIEAARKKHKEGEALLAAGEDVRASKRFMKALEFVNARTSFSHEEFKIVKILRSNFARDFGKCKTVWEGFEHAANWFNKMPELEEGTKVWNRHVQRPQEYYGGIIGVGGIYYWIM